MPRLCLLCGCALLFFSTVARRQRVFAAANIGDDGWSCAGEGESDTSNDVYTRA